MSVNNINGFNGQQPPRLTDDGNKVANGRDETRQTNQPQAEGKNVSTRDSLSLTDTAGLLRRVEASLADIPEVDSDKVDAIRKAIETGNYQVDAEKLADNLLNFEKSLEK